MIRDIEMSVSCDNSTVITVESLCPRVGVDRGGKGDLVRCWI